MEKQPFVKPVDLQALYLKGLAACEMKKAPSMGKSVNETQHRVLASHFLHCCQTWGYFKPHIHLAKSD